MKKLFALLPLFYFHTSFSQDLPDYDNIQLVEKADYKVSEPAVIKAATYMLSTPYEKNDVNRLKSLQFIMKWMTGTPDYSFSLDASVSKLIKGNDDLLGFYLAAMTKYCLENPANAKDEKLVKLNAIKTLITYCDNPTNNIKMTKQLKKLSEAMQKGELEQQL
ncbi:MAG: hypothetical protein ABI480_03405 [Chitinophagaceae bacterium]